MITALLIVGYALVGIVVAAVAGALAEEDDWDAPYVLGTLLGLLWPVTISGALGAIAFGFLVLLVHELADAMFGRDR